MFSRMAPAAGVGLVLALALSGSAWPGEDEKLLLGFERAEVEKAAAQAGKNAFKTVEGGDFQFSPKLSNNTALEVMNGIITLSIVQGDVTQGTHALKVPGPKGTAKYFLAYPGPSFIGLAADPRTNIRLPEVFNTDPWFGAAFPADWSGWDLLRVDVKVIRDGPSTLMLEVEDAVIEPPASFSYEGVKPNAWTTLEMDLGKAVEERKLDLKRMTNIFVRFDGRKDTPAADEKAKAKGKEAGIVVLLDNIRLARKGAACALPVVQGERSAYTRTLPRSYAAEIVWAPGRKEGVTVSTDPVPRPAKVKPAEPAAQAGPVTIDILPLLKKGFDAKSAEKGVTADNLHQFVVLKGVTAGSAQAQLVAFAVPALGNSMLLDKPFNPWSFGPIAAIVTTDGGKTWGGLDGPGETPTWVHKGRKAWQGTVFDGGADVMGLHDDGCLSFRTAYEFYPGDRVFLWRTIWTGEGWKRSPILFVSGDPRWCTHAAQNLLQLPSGRLWCMFSSRDRSGFGSVAWAMYSDDDGLTWRSWRGDGLVGTVPLKTRDEVRGELFPHGEHVGMLAEDNQMILFDGKSWAAAEPSPLKTPAQAVGCGNEIFAIGQNAPLAWYDGAAWKKLELPGREEYPRLYDMGIMQSPGAPEWTVQQRFSVCGETVLFIEPDKSGKKLLCWHRPKGGAWTGPQELASEETPFADVVAPRYSLAGFVPVAYNCWSAEGKKKVVAGSNPRQGGRELKPWVKVLQVPAQR